MKIKCLTLSPLKILKIRIRLRESNFLRTVSGKLQKMAGDKEEEGHLSSAVSNQSYWPQMITRGCAPFPPDITNCNFHLFPDRNTEFCKRPKRWTAMGCTGRLQVSTLLRFNASTPTSSGSERKRFLWSVGPEPLPEQNCTRANPHSIFKVLTCHLQLAWRTLWKEFRTD